MNITYPAPFAGLEAAIGYTFRQTDQLKMAMTHSSYSNEVKTKGEKCSCNERLEFLGDSVLSYVCSRYLYENFSELPEGEMSRIRAAAVCEKALCRQANAISLGHYLYLGHGEECQNGRSRPSILADAFEALLAAMYLDGGIAPVEAFLLPRIAAEIKEIMAAKSDMDFKTSLQQVIQQERGDLLEYVTVGETGPAHRKVFTVEARLNGNVIGCGEGSSKRNAEQNAAKEALRLFGI